MIYNNFYQIRDKLCNSSCIVNSSFNNEINSSIISLPNKTNASIISYKNNIYGLCDSDAIIIQNVSKEDIPTQNISIKKKYLNAELKILSKNNENKLNRIIINENISAILSDNKIYFYDCFVKINNFAVNEPLDLINLNNYYYVISQSVIHWYDLYDINNIQYGFISIKLENKEKILMCKHVTVSNIVTLFLVTNMNIYTYKLPLKCMQSNNYITNYVTDYTNLEFINSVKLINNFNGCILDNIYLVTIDKETALSKSGGIYNEDMLLISLSYNKKIECYLYSETFFILSYYLETPYVYSIVQFNDEIIVKNNKNNKIFKKELLFGNIPVSINFEEGFPSNNISINNSIYIDFSDISTGNEIYIPISMIPSDFSINQSIMYLFEEYLVFDGNTYGLVFMKYNYDSLIFHSYIKPFPYYNSEKNIIKNYLTSFNNKYYLLNQYTGLLEFYFSNEINKIDCISNYIDDESLFILPNNINVKCYKFNKNDVEERLFYSSVFYYDNIFNVIVFTLTKDIENFLNPFPIEDFEKVFTLNDICFVYSSINNFSPIISKVEALGMSGLGSNHHIKKNKIIYSKLLDIGHIIKTNINSKGSLLYSTNNLPLGIVVGDNNNDYLINNLSLRLLIDSHLKNNTCLINLSYTNNSEGNQIIDIVYKNDKILDILYYQIDNRKVSVLHRQDIKFKTDNNGEIFEIYDINNFFIGYVVIYTEILETQPNNIPYYLKQRDFLYLSPIFCNFYNLINDNHIFDSEKYTNSDLSKLFIKSSGMLFKNKKAIPLSLKVSKLSTSNFGLNLISIRDIDNNLFDKIKEQGNLSNNLSFHDIQKAIYSEIEGFLVTQISDEFNLENYNNNLLGNIIDKSIINNYLLGYITPYIEIKYYLLEKSIENSLWRCLKIKIKKPTYNSSLINYSI